MEDCQHLEIAFSSTIVEKAGWFSILPSTSPHKLPWLGVYQMPGEELHLLADSLWFSDCDSLGNNIHADFQLEENGAFSQNKRLILSFQHEAGYSAYFC